MNRVDEGRLKNEERCVGGRMKGMERREWGEGDEEKGLG